MFCSRILAETPDSVNSIGRFVTAGYLYPVRNSFAHFVVAVTEGELIFFQAKSLKLVFPPNLHGIGLMPMDELKVVVLVLLVKVDTPRSAVSAIGFEAREQEKLLCLTSNFQLLSPMILRWLCRHSHCREFQAYRPECCLQSILQVANQVCMLQAPDIRLSAAKGKLSSCLILSSRRLRIWSELLTLEVEVSPNPSSVLHELHVFELA